MIICFIFSLAGTFLFMHILRRIKFKNNIFVPIVGMMLGAIIESITTFFAYKYDVIQNIESWTQGNRSGASFMQMIIDPNEFSIVQGKMFASFNNVNSDVLLISVVIVLLVMIYMNDYIDILDVLSLGRDHAINLGLSYEKIVKVLLIITSILVSVSAVTGKGDSAQKTLDNDIVKGTSAYKNNRIIYLDLQIWYVSSGGFVGTNAMINEIIKAIEK